MAPEAIFTRQAQAVGARAGGDDDRLRLDRFAFRLNPVGTLAQVDHVSVGFDQMSAPALCLSLHQIHQIGSKDPIGKAGEIFNMRGGHQLTARDPAALKSRDQDRIEVGSCRVNSCRIPSRPGSDDH